MTAVVSPLPAPEAVAELLSGITGRPMRAKKAPPLNLNGAAPKIYAVYRDSSDHVVSVCVLDWPLAVYSGAAMMMFPKCTVDQAIKSGSGTDGLMDAVHEILNVCARLFNTSAHVGLEQFGAKREQLPADAQELLRAPAARLDAEVSVPALGEGRITILVNGPAK
jgi:hypothetical protein